VEQRDDGRNRPTPGGGDPGELVHVLINRFAVIQSATQRLRDKFAELGIEQFRNELDTLVSAVDEYSRTIKRIRARGSKGVPAGTGSDEDHSSVKQQEAERPPPSDGDERRSKRILYVEDDVQVSHYIASVLKSAGWHVTCVEETPEALKALYDSTFDVLLTDVRFRSGSGLTLAAHAEQQTPSIPVVILTAGGVPNEIPDSVSFVLQKPVQDKTLLAALEQACTARSSAQSSHRSWLSGNE
jgi:CheY-like chemotaxis protein